MLDSELATSLREAVNSVSREAVLTKRVLYDLGLAAAAHGIPLQVFTPQVDREGFDVIVDDGDHMKRIQLKTVLAPAGTARWDIHRRLLRPGFQVGERLVTSPAKRAPVLKAAFLSWNARHEKRQSTYDTFTRMSGFSLPSSSE